MSVWAYFADGAWSDSGAWAWVRNTGAPPSGSPGGTWHGYPLLEGGNVDTGKFLGYLQVESAPWVWIWKTGSWAYIVPDTLDAHGAWVWFAAVATGE